MPLLRCCTNITSEHVERQLSLYHSEISLLQHWVSVFLIEETLRFLQDQIVAEVLCCAFSQQFDCRHDNVISQLSLSLVCCRVLETQCVKQFIS